MSDRLATTPVAHATREECADAFLTRANEAVQEDRWMGVMFCITPQGRLEISRTTHNFPRAEFRHAVQELSRLLAEDPVPVVDDSLLPSAADLIRSRINGDGPKA